MPNTSTFRYFALVCLVFIPSLLCQAPLDALWSHNNGEAANLSARFNVQTQDWNGDGVADLLVANPMTTPFLPERLDIVSGADGSTLAPVGTGFVPPVTIPGAVWILRSFEFVGDVTGDGVIDIAVMREAFLFFGSGPDVSLEVYSGATLASVYSNFYINASNNLDPAYVRAAGDVNGDGVGDLAACLTSHLNGPGLGQGRVSIIDVTTGTQHLSVTELTSNAFLFGDTFIPIGDINSDGCEDFVCGGPGFDTSPPFSVPQGIHGFLRAISGANGAVLWNRSFNWGDLAPCGVFGQACRHGFPVRDRDGDSVPDFMMALADSPSATIGGSWSLRSGATGNEIQRYCVNPGPLELGRLRNAGDVNGDGIEDFATETAPNVTTNYVCGLSGLRLTTVSAFGFLAALGDIDGNGYDDVLVRPVSPSIGSPVGIARSLMGTRQYGATGTPLTLDYLPQAGVQSFQAGGASPFATLLGGFGPNPANTSFAGIPVFVDLATATLELIPADAFGTWTLPLLLTEPTLAGQTIYLQVVETITGLHSNGLEILFANP